MIDGLGKRQILGFSAGWEGECGEGRDEDDGEGKREGGLPLGSARRHTRRMLVEWIERIVTRRARVELDVLESRLWEDVVCVPWALMTRSCEA